MKASTVILVILSHVYMHITCTSHDFSCSCSGVVPTLTVNDYEHHLREVLEEVRKHIPKVFVNLVLLGNISEVGAIVQWVWNHGVVGVVWDITACII